MKKLNIGCGEKKIEGYEGLDIQDFGQEQLEDIFIFLEICGKEHYHEVRAEHFLEHFDQGDLKKIFNGVYRILKSNGIFEIIVPHKDKDESWVLTHKTFWTEYTFKAFESKIFSDDFGSGNWKIVELRTNSRKDIYCKLKKL